MRNSKVTTLNDEAGDYEAEVFDCPNPKRVIVCSHGNGVRRWDGEKFFYAVAEHYQDSVVMLVDQNQLDGDGVRINPLPILANRVQKLIDKARQDYPDLPIVLVGHSMGCGVAAQVKIDAVSSIIFIAPAVGKPKETMVARYGADIVNGKTVTTGDGLKKVITKEYFDSVKDISWEDEYAKLVKRFSPIHVFEAEEDEIVGEGRYAHRDIPFTSYTIVEGAKHNFSGEALDKLFAKLDVLF